MFKKVIFAILCWTLAYTQDMEVLVRVENVQDVVGMAVAVAYNPLALEGVDIDTTVAGVQIYSEEYAFLRFAEVLSSLEMDKFYNSVPGHVIIGYSSVPAVFNSGSGDCFSFKLKIISNADDSLRFIREYCKLHGMFYEIPAQWCDSVPASPSDTTRVILDRRISKITDDSVFSIKEYSLQQNYPNPFNSQTKVVFNIKSAKDYVILEVYDILGERLLVLAEGNMQPGQHKITCDLRQFSTGIYVLILRVNSNAVASKKLLLIK